MVFVNTALGTKNSCNFWVKIKNSFFWTIMFHLDKFSWIWIITQFEFNNLLFFAFKLLFNSQAFFLVKVSNELDFLYYQKINFHILFQNFMSI